MKPKASFLAFFLAWAERQGWEVPAPHVRICYWLEHKGQLAVLRCHRGIGKSTILAVYNAWRYWSNPKLRILHQSEADDTAWKTSRDTQHVLRNHPWTKGMLPPKTMSVESWWIPEALQHDPRNASMYAKGIMSNVTSARADEIQNDDVEVPRNIQNEEARERLRYRLGEQVHIAVPGCSRLFVGTPHTHDSIYDDMERLGADCLTIAMFGREQRLETCGITATCDFTPEFVFSGIGEGARLLKEGVDYEVRGKTVHFAVQPPGLIDFYAECAWPARFNAEELQKRRQQTRTVNEWDSQYQLHSKPVGEVRLDPDRIIAYDLKPVIEWRNRQPVMLLGKAQIVGAKARWDCAAGKIKADASAFSLVLTDARGNLYWQFSTDVGKGTNGDLDKQCDAIRKLVLEYSIPGITVETNGIGGFAPAILRKHLAGLGDPRRPLPPIVCGVVEDHATVNKQKRILDAFEGPISTGFLWAHVSVLDGPAYTQMRDFNPAQTNQPDDYIDSGAGAIAATPVRIGSLAAKISAEASTNNWRPDSGVHEVTVEA